MRRSSGDPVPPVLWVVIAGTFVLVIANADSAGERLVQVGVLVLLVGIYLGARRRARR